MLKHPERIRAGMDRLDGEERNRVYRMLRLEITPQEDGTLSVRGILRDELQIRSENGRFEDDLDFVPTERHLPLGRTVIAVRDHKAARNE